MESENIDTNNVITKTNLGVVKTSGDEMDEKRRNTAIIDYLKKLDEAKEWISGNIGIKIELSEFIQELPKGIWLAEIAKKFDDKIKERVHYAEHREYFHTENINMFLRWVRRVKLSKHFYFDVIDLYDSKNIPKVVYCIHGLANFLKIRGICQGIQKSLGVFTEKEKELVGSDIITTDMPALAFDEIGDRMESSESNDKSNSKQVSQLNDKVVSNSSDKEVTDSNSVLCSKAVEDASNVIRVFGNAYVWQAAFSDVFIENKVSVCGLRKFVSSEMVCGEEERVHELYQQIIEQFKNNYSMQNEKDFVLRSVRLLIENQCRLRQIPFREYPLANDYKLFKRVLYNLLHDYALIYKIMSNGFELPLGVFYPDTVVGDYHFSKFIAYLIDSGHVNDARRIAGVHFQGTRTFQNLTRVFDISGHDDTERSGRKHKYSIFDLNPVDVAEFLYNELPKVNEYEIYNRKAMLDEAIKDVNVRMEIARRATLIVEYVNERLNYILKMDLPYYARMFVSSEGFFEDFIEPAILLSNNFIIAELVKYIFYAKELFGGQTRAYTQEDLTYYKSKIDRTSNFDFSDYSPLRDWLESPYNKEFGKRFIENARLTCSINEAFLNISSDNDPIKVCICLEEVNNLIIVLKESSSLMCPFMKNMVRKMTLLRQKPLNTGSSKKIMLDTSAALRRSSEDVNRRDAGEYNCDKFNAEASCVESGNMCNNNETHIEDGTGSINKDGFIETTNKISADGIYVEYAKSDDTNITTTSGNTGVIDMETGGSGTSVNNHRFGNGNIKQNPHKHNGDGCDYAKEKFDLALDTQLIDLDKDDDIALDSILTSVKNRLVLLLLISFENNLTSILHNISADEAARFSLYTVNKKDIKEDELNNECKDKDTTNECNEQNLESQDNSLKRDNQNDGKNHNLIRLENFKKNLVEDLELLVQKNVIQKHNGNYRNVLELIAQDIIRNKCHTGISEYTLNAETLDALFKKNIILRDQLDKLYKYTNALFASMVTNKSGWIFNRQVEPHTRYGTYSYSLSVLKPTIYENVDSSNLCFKIMMDDPLVFTLEIYMAGELWQKLENIRVDELLRLQEDSILCFDVNGVMSCNVQSLLEIINTQYIYTY